MTRHKLKMKADWRKELKKELAEMRKELKEMRKDLKKARELRKASKTNRKKKSDDDKSGGVTKRERVPRPKKPPTKKAIAKSN